MSDADEIDLYDRSFLVTFWADETLKRMSNIRSITLVATTTDANDAQVLAYGDLVEEFGYEMANFFRHVATEVEE